MGVTGLWDILRPSGKLRSLTHLAVVDGFEGNPANLRGLRIGIDASIWFFHAAHGREGENPELRTLFFRCAHLMNAPFLPLFIFDGPKRPKVKRGKRISGEKHWLVDSMKGMIEAFGFEWRMAPGEAEAELAHLNSTGIIDAILSDDVDNFLFGAKIVIRNPSINLTGNSKHASKNADGRVDGNHSTIYTSADILAHPSVQLTCGGLILIGLLSGGDYHPAGLARCGTGIAHGLAKSGLGDELFEGARSHTRAELPEFLTRWRESLRSELRTNSRGHLGSKKPSLAKAIPDTFPDVDVLLSYTNPVTSATDAGARRTHTPPRFEREPDLAKLAHLCELHFEWGLKDNIIKRFRTVLWPSIVLRALRRSVLEADAGAVEPAPNTSTRERESQQDILGTPSKLLARHFSSMALGADSREDEDSSLKDLIVKVHSSRMHAYTDGILEYRLEVAPAQLVRLASAGIQGLRKPADTTYDVLPSESEDSDEVDEEEVDRGGTNVRKKRRGGGPPPEPESHLRVWMPACMVRRVLPDFVERYEATQEAKRAKKSKSKVPRSTARAGPAVKGKGKAALPSKKVVEAPPVPSDEENFDLYVSSSEEEPDGRASLPPLGNHLQPFHVASSQDAPLPTSEPRKPNAAMVRGVDDVFARSGMLPTNGVRQHSSRTQESPQHVLDVAFYDNGSDDAPGPSRSPIHHLSSPSKVLQRLDLNLNPGIDLPSKALPPITPPRPSSSVPRKPRPFPIAFEEEESSEDESGSSRLPTTFSGPGQYAHRAPATPPPVSSSSLRPQWRPLPVAREEEESSDDDLDAIPAELPVLQPSVRGLSQRTSADYTHDEVQPQPPPMPGLKKRLPEQQSSSLSPSKVRRRSPQQQLQGRSTQDDDFPDDRRQDHVVDTSIISLSSDSDCDDVDLGGLRVPVAPLLIARSRTVEKQRKATTPACANNRREDVEQEVIDLT